jgi:hypothetical protein
MLRRLVVAGLPEVDGRVFEGDMPPGGTPTPFVVVRVSNDSVISSWGARTTPVFIWSFVGLQDQVASYRLIDQLNSEVVLALTPNGEAAWLDEAAALDEPVQQQPGVLGARYLVEYMGVAVQDTRDETLEAIARPLQFNLAATSFRKQDHPVLAEMAYSLGQLVPSIQTDPTTATPTAASPLVYLRFSQPPLPTEQIALEAWWMEAQVNVHVITPDPISRISRLTDLGAALVPTTTEGWHVMHDSQGQNPLQVAILSGNATADSFAEGQIVLRARYVMWEPDEDTGPPVDHVILTSPMEARTPIP